MERTKTIELTELDATVILHAMKQDFKKMWNSYSSENNTPENSIDMENLLSVKAKIRHLLEV